MSTSYYSRWIACGSKSPVLDNASFVSERLVQSLRIPRVRQNIRVSGIAGSTPRSPIQSVASFQISPAHHNGRKIDVTAIVAPKVTCDLPISLVSFDYCHGATSLISPSLIQLLGNRVRLTYSSELTCLLMSFSTAGGLDLLAHLWRSKLDSVGCSAAAQIQVHLLIIMSTSTPYINCLWGRHSSQFLGYRR